MLKSPETITTGKDYVKIKEFPYRQLVGALMYLMIEPRPDLDYSVGFISRSFYFRRHMQGLKSTSFHS